MAMSCPIGFDAKRLREDVDSLPASRVARFAVLAPRVQWLETFVAHDKVYCVFLAESAEVIEEHARRTGFPANRIERVHGVIDPTCASA